MRTLIWEAIILGRDFDYNIDIWQYLIYFGMQSAQKSSLFPSYPILSHLTSVMIDLCFCRARYFWIKKTMVVYFVIRNVTMLKLDKLTSGHTRACCYSFIIPLTNTVPKLQYRV